MAARSILAASRRQRSQTLAESYPVSVIIPAHDAEATLLPCLSALGSNDLRNTQVLVVDDGSARSIENFLAAHSTFVPGLSVVRSDDNLGPAAARNLGLERSRHPYVLFLDADVVLPSDAVFWIRESLELYSHRRDVAGVMGCYSAEVPGKGFFTNFKNLYTCYLYSSTATISPYVHTPIVCLRKSVLAEAGGFDAGFSRAEDFRLGIRLGSRGYRFVIDRRLEAVHLKEYGLPNLLREDWRRIEAMASFKLDRRERAFALGAHRAGRLISLVLPGLILAGLGLAWVGAPWWIPLALSICFLVTNAGMFLFMLRRKGVLFAAAAALFSLFEMLWAELAVAATRIKTIFSKSASPAAD